MVNGVVWLDVAEPHHAAGGHTDLRGPPPAAPVGRPGHPRVHQHRRAHADRGRQQTVGPEPEQAARGEETSDSSLCFASHFQVSCTHGCPVTAGRVRACISAHGSPLPCPLLCEAGPEPLHTLEAILSSTGQGDRGVGSCRASPLIQSQTVISPTVHTQFPFLLCSLFSPSTLRASVRGPHPSPPPPCPPPCPHWPAAWVA